LLLTANRLSKSHGLRELFSGVSISIDDGERIGMIGPNGAGKSTLLRMLAGREDPDDGLIRSPRGTVTVYVPQRDDFEPGVTPRAACTASALTCADCHGDIHEAEVLAAVVLGKIGFDDARMDQVAESLSGGWRKRLSVACALASAGGTPDVLFLDEPTNHLDVEGLDWLENFILYGSQDLRARAVIFVTHDRVFLENCATRIVELSRAYPEGTLSVDGNYTEFRRRRGEFLQMQARAEASLANEVREDDRWLSRGAKARRTKAKGRIEESGVRRDELAGLASRNSAANMGSAGIDFNSSGRRTRKLISAEGVAKSMGGKLLFRNLDLELVPGECVGLMGPNGSGKTTLLRVLLGELPPDAGLVKRADPTPRVVSMTQTRSEFPKGTLLREAISPLGDKVRFRDSEMHVTAWSRRFLFRDEQLLQQVSMLSGGELARAHVARMMLEPADVLVLDEPTNDLDIPTLEVLEDAVEGFGGATLLVTHDRAMLDRLASRIVVLGAPDGIPRIVASLPQALRALEEFESLALAAAKVAVPASRTITSAPAAAIDVPNAVAAVAATPKKKLGYSEQRELDGMEKAIAVAEAKSAELSARLNDATLLANHAAYAKACDTAGEAQAAVTRMYARWEELEAKRA
jgi:ATP-binding cassette subfamily F protein uup